MSLYFRVTNGVKRDGVRIPVLYCVYLDGLQLMPHKTGFDCFIGAYFDRSLAYADVIV